VTTLPTRNPERATQDHGDTEDGGKRGDTMMTAHERSRSG
jgi:hypothetical protein